MLASLHTVVYMVSLVEISSYVNSRPDMKSIKTHWEDRFHVAVDSNDKIIGTIAFAEKKDICWKGVPVEGKTIEINSVLGTFQPLFHLDLHKLCRILYALKTLQSYQRVSPKGCCKKTDEISNGKSPEFKYIFGDLFCSIRCSQVLRIVWICFWRSEKKLFD